MCKTTGKEFEKSQDGDDFTLFWGSGRVDLDLSLPKGSEVVSHK